MKKKAAPKSTECVDEETQTWRASLGELQKRLGHRFEDSNLLETALTHPSYAHENDGTQDNDRLEFLGDAVLELIISEGLYAQHPNWRPGELSRKRTELVNNKTLAKQAMMELNLGQWLRLGRGEKKRKSVSEKILADAFEALLGAIYLDAASVVPVTSLLIRLLPRDPNDAAPPLRDFKTQLNELAHARRVAPPQYQMAEDSGAESAADRFTMRVHFDGKMAGKGIGRTKQQAEQEAARSALGRRR